MSEKGWLPTHLQQAEKVLDKPSAPIFERPKPEGCTCGSEYHRSGNRLCALVKTDPHKGEGLLGFMKRKRTEQAEPTRAQERLLDRMVPGKHYDISVHNTLRNTVTTYKRVRFQRADGNRVLWFVDQDGQQRYFRLASIKGARERR